MTPKTTLTDQEMQALVASGRAQVFNAKTAEPSTLSISAQPSQPWYLKSPLETALPGIGDKLRTAGEVAGQAVNTAAHFTGLPQLTGAVTQTMGELLGAGIGTIGGTVEGIARGGDFSKLGQRIQDTSAATGDFGKTIGPPGATAALELQFGGKILNILTAIPQLLKGADIATGKQAPDILGVPVENKGLAAGVNLGLGAVGLYGAAQSPGWLPFGVENLPGKALSALKNMRLQQVPEGVQTEILKGGGPGAASKQEMAGMNAKEKLYGYLDQAEKAKSDFSLDTPLDLAGQKAEDALAKIRETKNAFGEIKSAMVQKNANLPVNGLNEVVGRFGNEISDLGLQITPGEGGKLTVVASPTGAKVNAADIAEIQNMLDQVTVLGDKAPALAVDSTVDRLQSDLYGPKKNLYYQPSDQVTRVYKNLTSELNGRLKDTLGPDFVSVNQYYGALSDLYNRLNSALGLGGSKGGSLMKRIFSPTDGGTKQLFGEVRAATGIDLVQEATMAKFAMETVGDVRQRSLLEQVDLLRPGSSPLGFTSKAVKLIFDKIAKNYLDPIKVAQDIASGKLIPGKMIPRK